MTETPITWPRKVDLFGVGVSVTDYTQATEVVLQAARRRQPAIVACQAVHAVMTACQDPQLRDKVNAFDLVTPDGQPVRWAMNLLHAAGLTERVYGPELMLRLCRAAAEQGVSIFLYGGSSDTLEKLQANLLRQIPALTIAGAVSPPFRPLTAEEDADMTTLVNNSGVGLVFLGLGCPKQDHFAFAHRSTWQAVQVCVGAAFDFHAGVKKSAPRWMQNRGLEWFYRLVQEPKRLWKRYLVTNSQFLWELTKALWNRRRLCSQKQKPSSLHGSAV